jgi:hypothetical protein
MPLAKGSKNITIRVGLMPRLLKKHQEALEKRPTNTDKKLIGFVNDLLTDVIDKDDFLRVYAPAISYINVYDNVLYLKDNKIKNKEIRIFLQKEELWCDHDRSSCCEHIRYAFAIPEIAKLNLKRTSRSAA